MTLLIRDIFNNNSPLHFNLYATDSQQNWTDKNIHVPVESAVTLNTFIVSPDTLTAGENVTFAWDIGGTFTQAGINWIPDAFRPSLMLATSITTNNGTTSFTIPDYLRGTYTFTLWATDSTGVTTFKDSNAVTVNCPTIAFFVSDPTIQNDECAAAPAAAQSAAYQPFERGFMVWFEWNGSRQFAIIENNKTNFALYRDGGQTAAPTETPPAGLFAPMNGFGYLWVTHPSGGITSSEHFCVSNLYPMSMPHHGR